MSTHAGLYVHRNREIGNTLWYVQCLVSIYLHNKIQPILFQFLHRLVWLLNPKAHPMLSYCRGEPAGRRWAELCLVSPRASCSFLLFFPCPAIFLLFFSFSDSFVCLVFFCHHFRLWASWVRRFFTYMFALHLVVLGSDPKFGSVCYCSIDNNKCCCLACSQVGITATLLCFWALPIARLFS